MFSKGSEEGFEAWVESKDKRERLIEHQECYHLSSADQSPRTECFLETIDQPYIICIKKLPNLAYKGDWKCDIWVDGSSLKFSPLLTTSDQEDVTLTQSEIKRLGTIIIQLTPGTWKLVGAGPPQGIKINPKVGDEKAKKFAHTTSLTDSRPVHYTSSNLYRFLPTQPEKISYQFTFKYRSRVKLKLMRVIEEAEDEDQEDQQDEDIEKQKERTSTPFESSISATKKMIPESRFANAIDLSNSPPRKIKKRKMKEILLDEAMKLGGENDEKRMTSETEVKPESGSTSKRMKLLGEENQALRQVIRQLKMGQKIEEDAVDLTLDQYDSD
ncbi:hypothetical protein L486_03897 [Kwoniella mangroviensis CBS 10435]|uniref:DUF7918 domain-containing protein n=1 Tax=Kwoniella mangroviensis CBS 10435 TaxID=1331196 RepID=A0A1B9IQP7_9TREE|nr:hypothetical protein L486_03897 [Kwoniella mangroviensis CBS 10435]